MLKIVVASKNPVKISAALAGFQAMFPDEEFVAEGISVASGVSDQPKSDKETLMGALGRAENASKAVPTADYWVGLEGGIEGEGLDLKALAWVVIKSKEGGFGKGRTGTFFLPKAVAELIKQGKELGEADDIVFKRENSKQVNGAVGILTGNVLDRTKHYSNAVILALVPFKNRHLYFS